MGGTHARSADPRQEFFEVAISTCDVTLQVPDKIATHWRAYAVGAGLEPADVLSVLLHQHHADHPNIAAAPEVEATTAVTITMSAATLSLLDGLLDSSGAKNRSVLCTALLAEHLPSDGPSVR